MTANSFLESVGHLPLSSANAEVETICGISHFFDDEGAYSIPSKDIRNCQNAKDEYGDWQTSMDLALAVCRLLKGMGVSPKVIIEPTCGKGHFILAALQVFDTIEDLYGIEIHKPYIDGLKVELLQRYLNNSDIRKTRIHLFNQNVFDFDFSSIKHLLDKREVLVLGNPPWVTNSKLGTIKSGNSPRKGNFKRLGGIDAITGKANFDIAESIFIRMMELVSGENGHIAFLLKNSVIKGIVYDQKDNQHNIGNISQYAIDAKKEFNVSVAASLIVLETRGNYDGCCKLKDFYTRDFIREYGWVDSRFVADTTAYNEFRHIDGASQLIWRSGLKHDCAKVMELTFRNSQYFNGLGETVDIEDELIFPLVKSSDIKHRCIDSTHRYVIVTQHSTSDETEWLKSRCPKGYRYLTGHAEYFDHRGSRIYQGRPRFSIFGIGDYSFADYKVIVSGLYKKPVFSVVCPIGGKPVMLDDTCYMLGFDNVLDAVSTRDILSSRPVQSFLNSLLFVDAKRVISKELLMRVDLIEALKDIPDEEISLIKRERVIALLTGGRPLGQLSLF